VAVRCTVDVWEFEHSKLIGSVHDVFMFKQGLNSQVMQSIRLETNCKEITRDLLNCPSLADEFHTRVYSTGNVLDIIQGGDGVAEEHRQIKLQHHTALACLP
jgi:hypothetical protein